MGMPYTSAIKPVQGTKIKFYPFVLCSEVGKHLEAVPRIRFATLDTPDQNDQCLQAVVSRLWLLRDNCANLARHKING